MSEQINVNATPLVSVVIPSYNHAHYLGRALQSVLDQTYTHWEAFVIDNYSVDDTDAVMEKFTDTRINYLKIHNNGVIAASRNAGIRASNGEWIAFLDSDDWWKVEKLQACYECMNRRVDIIYHNMELINERPQIFRKKIIKSLQVTSPVLIDLMSKDISIFTSSVLVRAKLLKQINGMNESHDMIGAEDYNTWLRVAQLSDRFKHLPKQLGFYQLHYQGISSLKDMSAPTRCAASDFLDLLNPQQKNKFEANLSYKRGRFNYLTGNFVAAKKDLLIVIKRRKWNLVLKCVWMIAVINFTNIK